MLLFLYRCQVYEFRYVLRGICCTCIDSRALRLGGSAYRVGTYI